ncbi:MAG: tetratricopeptide repeat protein, partial [candidate division Zixibacteria bacterium]|nr:tetratricopeptide repeat protein [candidate division Zixibacteria bacterium]
MFGLDPDSTIILLTLVIVIQTCILIYFAARRPKKELEKVVKAINDVRDALKETPVNLDPRQPVEIPPEVDKLETNVGVIAKAGLVDAESLVKMGNIEYTRGNLAKAMSYYEQARELASDDRKLQATCIGNIGLIYKAKGDAEAALKYHEEALKIDREIGYRQGEA